MKSLFICWLSESMQPRLEQLLIDQEQKSDKIKSGGCAWYFLWYFSIYEHADSNIKI